MGILLNRSVELGFSTFVKLGTQERLSEHRHYNGRRSNIFTKQSMILVVWSTIQSKTTFSDYNTPNSGMPEWKLCEIEV